MGKSPQTMGYREIPSNNGLLNMNSMQNCNSITFYFMKNSISDINRKWILPNMIRARATLIIFGKMPFLLTSENEFTHEIKYDGITSLHGIHVFQ